VESTLFFVFGGLLVVSALVVAWLGMRAESFPGGRGLIAGVSVFFAVLVVGTAVFGWIHAGHEKEHREEELAKEEGEAKGEAGSEAVAGTVLDVSSPKDGSLVFEPDGLEASAGLISLVYTNPSRVPHNIHLEFEGKTIAESETISEGTVKIEKRLQPGEYVFYCDVPGHRQAGMEGDLTVSGAQKP